jgi:ribosomal protein L27
MAHKKGEGSTQNGRDSVSKRLGVKLYGGQLARAGNIIIRQRGTRYHAGENVYLGKDYSVHAKVDGTVQFSKGRRNWTFVSILPFEEVAETVAKVSKSAALKAKPAPKVEKVETVEVEVAIPVKAAEKAPAKAKTEKKEAAPEKAPAKAKTEKKEATPEKAPAKAKTGKKEAAPEKAPAKAKTEKKEAAPEKAPAKAKTEKKEAAPKKAPAKEVKAEKKKAAPKKAAPKKAAKAAAKDDLKKIEGIGPKIASMLNEAGFNTFAELAAAKPEKISEILVEAGGNRYKAFDPATWPQQASLAAAGKWDELQKLQDELKGGRPS